MVPSGVLRPHPLLELVEALDRPFGGAPAEPRVLPPNRSRSLRGLKVYWRSVRADVGQTGVGWTSWSNAEGTRTWDRFQLGPRFVHDLDVDEASPLGRLFSQLSLWS